MKNQCSVIVVNFNAKEYLEKCINSILQSNSPDCEIIVVDNGSADGSRELLRDKFHDKVKPIFLEENFGPALARNKGAEASRGKYLCFLDNDTEVHPDWAVEAIKEFENQEKIGVIQSKLLLAKERNKIDYVGEYLGQNGFLVQKAVTGEKDCGQYNQNIDILAAKSAGMFIRKNVFEKIGGFDEDYFIYMEETDLGWRSWLAGFECRLAWKSIVFHEFGTSRIFLGDKVSKRNAKFHGCKNYILTLFKNLEKKNLIKIFLPHIFLWLGLAGYFFLTFRFKEGNWIIRGIIWNLSYLPESIKKRKFVQGNRKISDDQLFKKVMKKKPFRYYFGKVFRTIKIGNAESF
jgi:GT2 family glycosyltransferase